MSVAPWHPEQRSRSGVERRIAMATWLEGPIADGALEALLHATRPALLSSTRQQAHEEASTSSSGTAIAPACAEGDVVRSLRQLVATMRAAGFGAMRPGSACMHDHERQPPSRQPPLLLLSALANLARQIPCGSDLGEQEVSELAQWCCAALEQDEDSSMQPACSERARCAPHAPPSHSLPPSPTAHQPPSHPHRLCLAILLHLLRLAPALPLLAPLCCVTLSARQLRSQDAGTAAAAVRLAAAALEEAARQLPPAASLSSERPPAMRAAGAGVEGGQHGAAAEASGPGGAASAASAASAAVGAACKRPRSDGGPSVQPAPLPSEERAALPPRRWCTLYESLLPYATTHPSASVR